MGQLQSRALAGLLALLLPLLCVMRPLAVAEAPQAPPAEQIAQQAKALWDSGAVSTALDLLDQGLHNHPQALPLHKLRGDILATSRGPQEAVQAYDAILAQHWAALDVRWAKWSVLVRWGRAEDSLAELQRIAEIDVQNPLVHLRLAQELRKLDRLEDSLESYKKAVALRPDLPGWRLALARGRFDLLDYDGANGDVQDILNHAPPGSPLEIPAKTLLSLIEGTSTERGRRYERVLTPDATEAQLKEWAFLRAEAWRLFEAGRYREAEPIYRRMLALNPMDPTATYQFGLTLMQVGQCQEALTIFRKLSDLDTTDEDYTDSVFRMGQCLVELERWEDAFVHFHILYETAVEFEEADKQAALPPGTRVLDKGKLAKWLDKVRPHVPELAQLTQKAPLPATPAGDSAPAGNSPAEDLFAKALDRFTPQKTLETGAALMGRDADFSWFRFVIPAAKVMRDDFPTGAHDFIPLNPGDSFPATQQEIYLVFGLVGASYDAVPLTAQCFLETAESTDRQHPIVQDHAMTTMNDQSGYFLLSRPRTGWRPGLYRCGLFAGDTTSAYNHVDEVRFRIIAPRPAS